jgi:hypothetical protein
MFDNLFDNNEWIHNDDFIDPASNKSHRYFDFSWDISRIYEDLHTRKRELSKQLARTIQKNSLLQKQLSIPTEFSPQYNQLGASGSQFFHPRGSSFRSLILSNTTGLQGSHDHTNLDTQTKAH